MADEKIVFEVDVSSLAKALGDSQTQLEIYKRDMEAAVEANGRFSEQANKAAGLVAAQTKAVQQQTGAITRLTQAELALGGSINDIVKGYNASNKSVEQNRKVLNALTAEYNKLTGAARTNLVPSIKAISDELKKQEGAIGDTRRNVGNYRDEFTSMLGGITSAGGAFGSASKAALGFGTALATGTGGLSLIIPALTSFYELVSTNAEVADELSFAMGGLNKVAQVFADVIVEGVKSLGFLKNAFSDPIGTIKELGNVIYDNVITRLKSFGVLVEAIALAFDGKFKEAGKRAIDATLQLTVGVENLGDKLSKAASSGYEAARSLDNLAEKQAVLNGEASIAQKQAEALVKSLKDRTKSEAERINIATKAADLEIKAADKLAQSKQLELDIEKERQKGVKVGSAEVVKIKELEYDVIIALEEKKNIEAQKQTRINILLEKQASEEKIRIKSEEIKSLDAILKKEKEATDKFEQEQNKKELDALVVSAQITAKRLGTVDAAVDAEIIARQRLLQNETLTATERENIIRQSEDRILEIKFVAGEKNLKFQKEIAQENAEVQQAQLTFAGGIANGLIGFIGDVAEATGTNAAFAKGLALFQIGINTAVALTGAILQAQSVPFPANLVAIGTGIGAVLGGIGAAIGILTKSGEPPATPKFATGVIGLDGQGTETSDSIDARLSKGESVLTAKATRKYHRQLAYMEMSVGNKPNYQFGGGMFAGGFIPSVSGDGGFLARETIKQSDSALLMSEAIRNGFSNAPAPVLSIVELNTKQKDINRSVNLSEA